MAQPILGKLTPVSVTTSQRDAVVPTAAEGNVIIWHETLSRLEYWDGTQWVPFEESFAGDTGFNRISGNVGVDVTETDIDSIVVPTGGFYRVESAINLQDGVYFAGTAFSFLAKLTTSANTELARAVIKGKTTPTGSELYYYSVNLRTDVDTHGGSQTIKLRASHTGDTISPFAAGAQKTGMYYHKIQA